MSKLEETHVTGEASLPSNLNDQLVALRKGQDGLKEENQRIRVDLDELLQKLNTLSESLREAHDRIHHL